MTEAFDTALALGAAAFNAGEYVDAYEAWFEHWSEEESADADLLQGLLQVAVAFAKLEGGDRGAAAKLLKTARAKLGPYAPATRSVDVSGLVTELDTWMTALESEGELPSPPRVNRVVLPRIRVVAGLFRRGATVLAQRRPEGKARAGMWEFPGGKVEPGESDEDALVRECQEELGVSSNAGQRAWETVYDYEDLTVELFFYHAVMPADAVPVAGDEGSELRWVDVNDLGELEFCPADEPLIAQLQAEL